MQGYTLKEIVAVVNCWKGRPSMREMLKVVHCRHCGEEFPVQSQDYALWTSKGVGFCCGRPACRQKQADDHNANRRRARAGVQ